MLILTDGVIIHIRHAQVLDIKPKHCKWIVVKLSVRQGRREKRGIKERGQIFQMKAENENISFSF